MKPLRIHEAARREANAAAVWLEERSRPAAENFVEELLAAFAKVHRFPQRYPSYLYGTQRLRLHKFSYSVIYLNWQEELFIVAVAHHKRRTGYWKNRV